MRLKISVVVTVLALAGTALAQTAPTAPGPAAAAPIAPVVSECPALPAPPAGLPDGATATAAQMEAGNATVAAWREASDAAITCRRDEATRAAQRARSLTDQYNALATTATAAQTAWRAESQESAARFPQRNRPQAQMTLRQCEDMRRAQEHALDRQDGMGAGGAGGSGARSQIEGQYNDCLARAGAQ